MDVVIELLALACLVAAAIWFWRRQSPVCDVCGTAVAADTERCPKCGADFTDSTREYHSLS
jgi:tRNA(Ile2) C34 agmatinyltransferase TiaS